MSQRVWIGLAALPLVVVLGLVLFSDQTGVEVVESDANEASATVTNVSGESAPLTDAGKNSETVVAENESPTESSTTDEAKTAEVTASPAVRTASALLRIQVFAPDGVTAVKGARIAIDSVPHSRMPFGRESSEEELRFYWDSGEEELELCVPAKTSLLLDVTGDRETTKRTLVDVVPLEEDEERTVRVVLRARQALHFFGLVLAAESDEPLADAEVLFGGKAEESQRGNAVLTDVDGIFFLTTSQWPETATVRAPGRPDVKVTVGPRHELPGTALEIRVAQWAAMDLQLVAMDKSSGFAHGLAVELSYRKPLSKENSSILDGAKIDPEVVGTFPGVTDHEGRISFERVVPDRDGRLTAKWNGQVVAEATFPGIEAGTRADWVAGLKADMLVTGELIDINTERPVPERELWFVPARFAEAVDENGFFNSRAVPMHSVMTDEYGSFEVSGIQHGTWLVGAAPGSDVAPIATRMNISAFGYRSGLMSAESWEKLKVEDRFGEIRGSRRINVSTARNAMIYGVVTVKHGELPRQTVVSMSSERGLGEVTARVAEDGTFSIGPVLEGRYALYAIPPSRSGYIPIRYVTREKERFVAIELCEAAKLFGRVVDNRGEPLNGRAWLSSSDPEASPFAFATTEVSDGLIVFEDIPGGTWDVFFRTPDGLFAVQEYVDVVAHGPDAGTLVANRGGTLRLVPPKYGADEHFRVTWNQMPVAVFRGAGIVKVPDGSLKIHSPWYSDRILWSGKVGRGEQVTARVKSMW